MENQNNQFDLNALLAKVFSDRNIKIFIVVLLSLIFLNTCGNGSSKIKATIKKENKKTIKAIQEAGNTEVKVYLDEDAFTKKVDSIMDVKMKEFLIIEDAIDKKKMKIEDLK